MKTRKTTWRPTSRKSLLRQVAREEGAPALPRDSLEVLRLLRHHPGQWPVEGYIPNRTQRELQEAEVVRLNKDLRNLPAQAISDLYRAQGEASGQGAVGPKPLPRKSGSESATPSTRTSGTNE